MMSDKDMLKTCLKGVLECVLQREEGGFYSKEREKLRGLGEILRGEGEIIFDYSNFRETYKEELKILHDFYSIDVVDKPTEGKVIPLPAVFRGLTGLLMSYITARYGRRIDHAVYNEELLSGNYSSEIFPEFARFDKKIPREGKRWKLKMKDGRELVVRPPEMLDELYFLIDPTDTFCYFDINQNIAQLYFLAAHLFARNLIIKEIEDGKEGKALGLVPMYMMRNKNIGWQSVKEGLPWLYVEAPMLSRRLVDPTDLAGGPGKKKPRELKLARELAKITVVLGRRREENLLQTLQHIVGVYAGLQKPECAPLIGTCRKIDNKQYGAIMDIWVSLAEEEFVRSGESVRIEELLRREEDGLELQWANIPGDRRLCSGGRDEGQIYLELPEDKDLLAFLKKRCGYRFPTLIMYTQAFMSDGIRKKSIVYDGWGEMRGRTEALPVGGFMEVYKELVRARIKKK